MPFWCDLRLLFTVYYGNFSKHFRFLYRDLNQAAPEDGEQVLLDMERLVIRDEAN